MTTKNESRPSSAYASRAQDVYELLKLVEDGIIDCTTATWEHVAPISHARALLVEAAFTLGRVSADEARDKYGVAL